MNMKSSEIRKKFLDFFATKDHLIIRSASLVPVGDPTLLFVNAGMAPMKNYFLGIEKPPSDAIASSQKCVRAGGKHNDLSNVGHTTRHHTFFEMLGNFSFGRYFKEGAIRYAWDFITGELALDPKKLHITVHYSDNETYQIWQKYIPKDRIQKLGDEGNFWRMGNTGPCGPCTEIFYDHGEHLSGRIDSIEGPTGDRFIEIWNLVFTQFTQLESGELVKIPTPCVDTGIGLERISAVVQGVHDNYNINLFDQLITTSKQIIKGVSNESTAKVIADHLRSSAFLIADGVSPENEGRGYALRKIIRRAGLYAHQANHKEPILCKMLDTLVREMQDCYPELAEKSEYIRSTLQCEEESFISNMCSTIEILNKEIQDLTSKVLPGATAFKLHDTYGLPIDVTIDVLQSLGMSLDEIGFQNAMTKQKERSKANWMGSGDISEDDVWFQLLDKFGPTKFIGYDHNECETELLHIAIIDRFQHMGVAESQVNSQQIGILLKTTPFYAESGGQEADHGTISVNDIHFRITNVHKVARGKLYLHICDSYSGKIPHNEQMYAHINLPRRKQLAQHHTSVHLLHSKLRQHLGEHIQQQGSLASHEKLRFDFNHQSSVSNGVLDTIEQEINDLISVQHEVQIAEMTKDQALSIGATALFGEKYGDMVRVVTINNCDSIELCGGTHVSNIGEISSFKIISEGSIASGIRRIEAVSGKQVIAHLNESLRESESEMRKLSIKNLDLKKQMEQWRSSYANCVPLSQSNKFPIYYKQLLNADAKTLREVASMHLKSILYGILVIISNVGDDSLIIVGVSSTMQQQFGADAILKKLKIKGGGNATIAQGGMKHKVTKIDEFVEKLLLCIG